MRPNFCLCLLILASCYRGFELADCSIELLESLCSDPCRVQTSCRSWWPADGGADGRRRRRDGVECRPDACGCGAEFGELRRPGTGGEKLRLRLFCLEGELAVCSGAAYNLTCPWGTRLKIWYAYFGRSGSDHSCPPVGSANASFAAPAMSSTTSAEVAATSATPPSRLPVRPPDACMTPVLTAAIHQCDGRQSCWLRPDELLADVTECRWVPEPHMLLDFACLGASDSTSSTEQELFFRWGLLLIGALFPLSLLALLVTVQLRKKRQDAYKMNSMHLPLTRHENPEI